MGRAPAGRSVTRSGATSRRRRPRMRMPTPVSAPCATARRTAPGSPARRPRRVPRSSRPSPIHCPRVRRIAMVTPSRPQRSCALTSTVRGGAQTVNGMPVPAADSYAALTFLVSDPSSRGPQPASGFEEQPERSRAAPGLPGGDEARDPAEVRGGLNVVGRGGGTKLSLNDLCRVAGSDVGVLDGGLHAPLPIFQPCLDDGLEIFEGGAARAGAFLPPPFIRRRLRPGDRARAVAGAAAQHSRSHSALAQTFGAKAVLVRAALVLLLLAQGAWRRRGSGHAATVSRGGPLRWLHARRQAAADLRGLDPG